MSNKRLLIIVFILLIIAAIAISIVMAVDEDTGDFNIKYVGNAKKYESLIKQGVNRWSSIGTGGVYVEFRTGTLPASIVASTFGSTVTIAESVFNSLSSAKRILTIAHEVGHVLGIGTWNDSVPGPDLLQDGTQLYLSNTKYPKTAKAYIDNIRPTGVTLPGAPIESQASLGSGSYKVHWENDPAFGMKRDLMTYKIELTADRISIVDLTYLQEIGKKVDLGQAEPLKATLSSVIGEYIFEDDGVDAICGSCIKCNED
tara:strand:- start:395 stop:1168 length:774 start_codon:yes stop_codon:yes gene_type:complete